MAVLHRTSNATRGAMAATMDHSSIRGLATAFHLFFAGLPRSEDGDHPYGMPTQNFRGFPSSFPRIALPVRWSVYRKDCSGGPPALLEALWKRSGERLNLASDIPDKAAQLSSDGHTDLVLGQLASHSQMSKAFGQAQLGTPGDLAGRFGLPLLTYLQVATDSGAVAISPGGLNEDTAGVFVTGLGDTALMAGSPGRELRGHQSKVSHQGGGVGETAQIAEFGDQGDCAHEVKATQTHQRLHQGTHTPLTALLAQRFSDALKPVNRRAILTRLGGSDCLT